MSKKRAGLGYIIAFLVILQMLFVASPSDGLNVSADTDLADSDASFWGEQSGEQSGFAVSGAGDVNGDGYDDFLIGAPLYNPWDEVTGRAYLILGKSSGWKMDTNLSNADASFWGREDGDQTGYSVSGVGDVNGDGYDDFTIGSYTADPPVHDDGGITYLILGKASGWEMDTYLQDADASFFGQAYKDYAGRSISAAGDVNGDGYDDFIIGAIHNDENGHESGQTYLILGKASGWEMRTRLHTGADASFIGEVDMDESGCDVSGVGDVNGDGYDDFIIGAQSNREADIQAGQTYLIFGKATGWAMDTSLSDANASFWGKIWQHSGSEVSGAGDVNADGYDDFLIGVFGGDLGGGPNVGQIYLIFGRATDWEMDTRLSNANASFWSEVKGDHAGYGLSGVGDVNGDGFDDFIIGAFENDDGGDNAGQTYLILGKASGWEEDVDLSEADASFWGEDDNDYSGLGISGAGDVNGDGYDDILIGAYGNSEGGPSAGQTYLIFPDRNNPPDSLTSLDLYYPDGNYTRNMTKGYMGNEVHVRVNGSGGDPTRRDLTEVRITSSKVSTIGFTLRLLETKIDSDTFDGHFVLANLTHKGHQWIGTSEGATITVTSLLDPSKTDSLLVVSKPVITGVPSDLKIEEDAPFNYTFTLFKGTAASWTHETNITWWQWNASNQTFWGTPTNVDIGTGYVSMTVLDDHDYGDSVNMSITVVNTPPVITSKPPGTATEDRQLSVDFDSSDDGQGDITWHLNSSAPWLSINSSSGELTGHPTDTEVGTWWVNVSVDDGNGGWDYSLFDLEVLNVADVPVIDTEELPDATEEVPYSFTFECTDPDMVDSFTWTLVSVIGWLEMNATTGVLSGTPSNDNVGEQWVDVRVTDSYDLVATVHLKLMVVNVNDIPTIVTECRTTIDEDVEYLVIYQATDPDLGDVLTWSLETDAGWLDIDENTGILSGTPTNDDIGLYSVEVMVSDGMGETDSHEFILEVTGINDLPEITSDLPPSIEVFEDMVYSLDLDAIDEEDGDVAWSDDTALFDISPGLGTITFTPSQSEVGEWWVNITAEDSEGLTDVVLIRFVVLNVNDVPVITSLLPEDGSKYKEGKMVTFTVEATDEDGDDLTVTWTSDGVTIGTGETLDYKKLKPGTRTIRVTVSDGETSVEDEFTVVITKEDESPALGGVLVLLAMLVGMAVFMMRRKGESDCLD